MQTPNRFVILSSFGFLLVGLLALLSIVGMTFWLGERAQVYFDDVIEARDTRAYAVDLRNSVQTAESSQRGFILTGNEIYLAPYDTAKVSAQRQLDALKRILAPYRQSDVIVQRLTAIVAAKFMEMDQTITLKRNRRDTDAMAVIRTNRGKALTDEANVFFSGVIRSADDRLTTGVEEQRRNANWLRSFSIIGAIVIIAVVGGAAFSLLRHARELRAAHDEVDVLNAELEGRVASRTEDLARANDEIQRFSYIVTHDLRAPLVNIMGFTAEIESGMKSLQALVDRFDAAASTDPGVQEARTAAKDDLPEAIGFIRTSTKKMDSLINAILKLSREGRRPLQPERVDLAEVVATTVASLKHQISEANGEIDTLLEVPPITSDRLSVEQIFGNLLDNAVKYHAKNRPLRISVRANTESDDRVGIEVTDNGRGIPDQDQQRIFELFRRSGAQDQPGEGIGLAYVRAIVLNLGGEITVRSTLDEGTTFRVVLPRTMRAGENPVT